mmetsp:Transcript_9072/g.16498  ORF Transcript_9072/g.16498 Transcript_9072/m.16498 type:complete len:273 (-) Transcript_9072:249-1067(-)
MNTAGVTTYNAIPAPPALAAVSSRESAEADIETLAPAALTDHERRQFEPPGWARALLKLAAPGRRMWPSLHPGGRRAVALARAELEEVDELADESAARARALIVFGLARVMRLRVVAAAALGKLGRALKLPGFSPPPETCVLMPPYGRCVPPSSSGWKYSEGYLEEHEHERERGRDRSRTPTERAAATAAAAAAAAAAATGASEALGGGQGEGEGEGETPWYLMAPPSDLDKALRRVVKQNRERGEQREAPSAQWADRGYVSDESVDLGDVD